MERYIFKENQTFSTISVRIRDSSSVNDIQDFFAKKYDAPTCRRLIYPFVRLANSLPFSLACLVDGGDANLEIHGDVVSSGFDSRDLYILL